MIGLDDWLATARFPERPWLVLGKGPTFSRRHEFDLDGFNTLALNHAVREMPVDVAHAIDVEVVEDCADVLADHCRYLLMPRVPHVRHRNSLRTLDDFVAAVPVLSELDAQGRLVWYNTEADRYFPGAPVLPVRAFSSEAALGVLGHTGARVVRSLGVDGGRSYSAAFDDLDATTRLANGQPDFDVQFDELDRIAARHGIDFRPLVEPIRIFVGTDESQLVATRVLEHSIRANTKHPVRVTPLIGTRVPTPRRREHRARTAFSFHRFAIPELCGHEGRAIYLDADMQVFGDVEELWTRPFDGHRVMVTRQDQPPPAWRDGERFHPGRQMSVMVLDCSRLDWRVDEIVAGLDAGRYGYEDLMFDLCVVGHDEVDDSLPPEWNHLEHYEPGVTKLLHYTVVPTQPWKNDANPLAGLWAEGYREAVAAGAVDPAEVRRLAAAGLVKSSLVDALAELPPPAATAAERAAAAVELDAVLERLDALEGRRLRRRARRAAARLRPLAERVSARGGRAGRAVDAVSDRLRRVLR